MATSNTPESASQADQKPLRNWREIATQLSDEYDHNKALILADELIHSLDAESRKRLDGITAKQKGAA